MKSLFFILFILLGQNFAKAEAKAPLLDALDQPGETVLYSLDPSSGGTGPAYFHFFRIFGQTTLSAQDSKIAAAEFKRAALSAKPGGPVALCFNPRHGLRVKTTKGFVDYVLCYECLQMQAFDETGKMTEFNVGQEKNNILNDLLTKAKVPLTVKKSGPTDIKKKYHLRS